MIYIAYFELYKIENYLNKNGKEIKSILRLYTDQKPLLTVSFVADPTILGKLITTFVIHSRNLRHKVKPTN